jgi:hypothetical protein
MVHRSSIFVFCGQREIIWFEDVLVARKPLAHILPVDSTSLNYSYKKKYFRQKL